MKTGESTWSAPVHYRFLNINCFERLKQRGRLPLIASVVVCVFMTPAMIAAQTRNSAIDAIVADVSSIGGTVEIGATEPGSGPDDIRLSNLKIAFPSDKAGVGVVVAFTKLELSGFRLAGAKFELDHAKSERVTVASDAGAVSLTNVALDKFSAPRSRTNASGSRAYALLDVLKQIAEIEFKQISANGLKWESPLHDGVAVAIEQIALSEARNGEIGRVALFQPKRLQGGGEKRFGADSITIDGLAVARLLEIWNPGVPTSNLQANNSREWKTLAQDTTIDNFQQVENAARTDVAQIQFSGLRVRRIDPDALRSFDLAMATPTYLGEHPDQARKLAEAFADAVKLDHVTAVKLSGADGQSPVPRRFGIARIELVDLDPLRAGSISLNEIENVGGGAGLSVGRVNITDLRLVVSGPAAGDPQPKVPIVGGAEIENVKFVQPGALVELGAFKWDAPNYRGVVPTHLQATVSGLKLPVAMTPDPAIRESLIASGVTSLSVEADVSMTLDELNEQASVEHFGLGVEKLGQIDMSGTMVDLPSTAFDGMGSLRAAAFAAAVKSLKFRFRDSGLVGHSIDAISRANKQPADQIRKALTTNMPMILGAIPDASTRNNLVFALVGFINDPRGIELTSLTQSPVPVAALDKAVREAPATIPALLKINATLVRTP